MSESGTNCDRKNWGKDTFAHDWTSGFVDFVEGDKPVCDCRHDALSADAPISWCAEEGDTCNCPENSYKYFGVGDDWTGAVPTTAKDAAPGMKCELASFPGEIDPNPKIKKKKCACCEGCKPPAKVEFGHAIAELAEVLFYNKVRGRTSVLGRRARVVGRKGRAVFTHERLYRSSSPLPLFVIYSVLGRLWRPRPPLLYFQPMKVWRGRGRKFAEDDRPWCPRIDHSVVI